MRIEAVEAKADITAGAVYRLIVRFRLGFGFGGG